MTSAKSMLKAFGSITLIVTVGCAALTLFAPTANAVRIKDLTEIQGVRGNEIQGVGLVVGLAGTGDSSKAAQSAQENYLLRMGVIVDNINDLKTDNVAMVSVRATIPAYAKEGTRIDVQVNSLFDSESLEGGTLISTNLTELGGEDVYAVAQGAISVGGFNVNAGGASVTRNHVTVGRIPMGAYVEREVPSTITDGERIMLILKRPDFATANNIQVAINDALGDSVASALSGGAVGVTIPMADRRNLFGFIARVQGLSVEADVPPARVIINERTGTIVITGDVTIRPCQVAHGSLTITVSSESLVSQPRAFSAGETTEVENLDITVVDPIVNLMPVEGVSADDVARALNSLKVTPRDMFAIFQAIRRAGAMDADLEIM